MKNSKRNRANAEAAAAKKAKYLREQRENRQRDKVNRLVQNMSFGPDTFRESCEQIKYAEDMNNA